MPLREEGVIEGKMESDKSDRSDILDHGMNIQMALEASRFTKRTFEACDGADESPHPRLRPTGVGREGS
jgi:hypothetical protein